MESLQRPISARRARTLPRALSRACARDISRVISWRVFYKRISYLSSLPVRRLSWRPINNTYHVKRSYLKLVIVPSVTPFFWRLLRFSTRICGNGCSGLIPADPGQVAILDLILCVLMSVLLWCHVLFVSLRVHNNIRMASNKDVSVDI